MTRRPTLLLSNDDGIDAPGIRALHAELREHFDCLVVAPMRERSGAGCSLSLSADMAVEARQEGGRVWGYAVDGTPADCVKFALTAVPDFKPRLVLSGINRGMNAGNSVFYSGTVAAAIEATLFGFPALACSLACWGHPEAFYADAARVVHRLLPWLLAQDHEPRTLWNLNMPNRRIADFGAVRLTTHGTSFFEDLFELDRTEGSMRYYRNIGTRLTACSRNRDSDDRAVEKGEISLSLLRTDLTVPVPHAAARSLEKEWARLMES